MRLPIRITTNDLPGPLAFGDCWGCRCCARANRSASSSSGWAEAGPVPKVQEELLKTFADQAVIAIENVRLFEAEQQRSREISESLEQQTATSEVLRVISSSPGELEPVFESMLANATRLCEAKFGILYRCEGDALRTVAMHDAPQPFVEVRRSNPMIRPNPDTTLGRAMATKQPVQIADILEELDPLDARAAQLPKLAGARTVLAVPMLKENELVGAFVIYRTEVRLFNDKQIELVKNFAAQAVIAIENTRLLNELRQRTVIFPNPWSSRRRRQRCCASSALRRASWSRSLTPCWRTQLASVRLSSATFGSSKAIPFVPLQSFTVRKAISIIGGAIPCTPCAKIRESPIDRLTNTKQVVHIPDLRTDQSYTEKNDRIVNLVEVAGARTVAAVPMLKEGELIGAISMYRQEVRPFTEKQIELVGNFAAQAVIAIENTRLLNELRQSLEQQTATADVLRVISSSPGELEPVFQAMLANAMSICDAKFGIMYEFGVGQFRAMSWKGVPPAYAEFVKQPRTWGPGTGLGETVRAKQIVHINDVLEGSAYAEGDPGRIATVDLGGVRTALIVPMLREDELVGAFVIYRQEVRPFTDKQIELVQNFAAQAVIAIENTRLLNELTTIARSADSHGGRAARHQLVSRRTRACVPGNAGERNAHMRSKFRHPATL